MTNQASMTTSVDEGQSHDLYISVRSKDRTNKGGSPFNLIVRCDSLGISDNDGGEIVLRSDFLKRLTTDLGNVKTSQEPSVVLAGIGMHLFDVLFPKKLQDLYRDIHNEIQTIHIVSEETYIPWQLVKPFFDGEKDHPFLGEKYIVTRWWPHNETRFKKISGISPSNVLISGLDPAAVNFLPYAKDELSFFTQDLPNMNVVVPVIPPKVPSFYDALKKGSFLAFHLACHTDYNPNMEFCEICLDDERVSAMSMRGAIAQSGEGCSLFFFNTCSIACPQNGYSESTGASGFIPTLIKAKVRAIICTHWDVSDDKAPLFSRSFYTQLTSGKNIGEAFQSARLKIKNDADPTWLSYTLFGDPFGHIPQSQTLYEEPKLNHSETTKEFLPINIIGAKHPDVQLSPSSTDKTARIKPSRPGFSITISGKPVGGWYDVTAISSFSPYQKVQSRFKIPYYNEDDYLNYSVHNPRGRLSTAPPHNTDDKKTSIDQFGNQLYEALFSGEIENLYADAVDKAFAQFPISIVTDIPAIVQLPWEFLHDGHGFICTDVGPIFRVLPNARPSVADLFLTEPLRLLIVPSNPSGSIDLDIEQEEKNIRSTLRNTAIEIFTPISQKIEDFMSTLLECKPHIIHFIGHGENDSILFKNYRGEKIHLDEVLGQMVLNTSVIPKIVILNACFTATASTKKQTVGLAAQLVQKRVPMTVAMQFAISDDAALAFSRGFYEYIAFDFPIQEATAWGRLAIKAAMKDSLEWATPVIYVNPAVNLF